VVFAGLLETPAVLAAINCKLGAPDNAPKDLCIETGGSGLGLLRCARLLKLGKLMSKFPGIAFQLKSILSSLSNAYTVLFLLAIATFVFAILAINSFGGTIRIQNLESPIAQKLFRHGARVFVKGLPQHKDGSLLSSLKDMHPASIINISFDEHPVRPLQIQPRYGYTYTSKASDMMPFWSPKPALSLSASSDSSEIVPIETSMVLDAAIPRFNADTFWDALLMAFQLSIGADISETLTLAVASGDRQQVVLSYIFFALVIMLGNWVLFNCFIATMIVSFRREAIVAEQAKERQGQAHKTTMDITNQHSILSHKEKFQKRIERMAVDGRSAQEVMSTITSLSTYKRKERTKSGELLAQALMEKQRKYEDDLAAVEKEELRALGMKQSVLAERCRILKERIIDTLQFLDEGVMLLTAPDFLGLVDPLDPWRVRILSIVRSKTFQQMIYLLLLCSTVCLAMERRGMGLAERNALDVINLVLNLIFAVEFLLKAFALSFETYFKDPLNQIDFIIVLFGIVDTTLTLMDPPLIKPALQPSSNTEVFGVLRILRIVKTLRPLRMILFKIERVRIVIHAMQDSIGPLQLAAMMALMIVLVMGVFSQQLLAGKMSACSDPFIFARENCIGVDAAGISRIFKSFELNCDWVFDSIVLMFTAITKDRWREILWSITDITDRQTGPYIDASWSYAILLLVSVIVGSIFTMNLLVALFVESYSKEMIKVRQKVNDMPRCLMILGRQSLPRLWNAPKSKTRRAILQFLESSLFSRCLTLIFYVNFVVACMSSYKNSSWVSEIRRAMNSMLAITFGAEAALKMLVLGPARYLANAENARDFISALLTLAGETLEISDLKSRDLHSPTCHITSSPLSYACMFSQVRLWALLLS
jgi:hypothetical protein